MTRRRALWVWRLLAFLLIELLLCTPVFQSLALALPRPAAPVRGAPATQTQAKRAAIPAANASRAGVAPASRPRPEQIPLPVLPAAAEADGKLNDAWVLFDGDASTRLRGETGKPVRVRIAFASPQRIDELAIFGSFEGTIGVFAERDGAHGGVDGLTELRSGRVAHRWARFAASSPVRSNAVVLEWVPSGELGPAEVVFWGLGPAFRPMYEAELGDRILAGALAGSVEALSPRSEAEVLRPSSAIGFPVQLETDPRSFARAFLVYELHGLGHWSSALRRINGGEARGGSRSAPAEGGLQVEEISPRWLRRGENAIEFLPLRSDGAASYRVRNVRIVGVPHAMAVEAIPRLPTAAGKVDGRFDVDFSRQAQPLSLLVELDAGARSRLEVLGAGGASGGRRQAKMSFELRELSPGWHRFDLDERLRDSTSLSLSIARSKHQSVRNALVTASAIPVATSERLAVTYPLHGECENGTARIFGFVEKANLAGTRLRVVGEHADQALANDGSFELTVVEPPGRRAQPWQVRLEASTGAGKPIARVVTLDPCLDAKRAIAPGELEVDEGAPYARVVDPKRATTLSFAGARLDIPPGAVDAPTRITIRPLVGDQVRPMGRAMQNVSPEGRAFRFGPHGLKFKKPIKITLPIDRAALRPGLGERDVQGFYFEEEAGRWIKIGRYGAEPGAQALSSITEHFTDFVNATLAMPDSPGTTSFNPNQLDGMELGDPSAGITLVEAPDGDSSGSARLSHAIEVPPGRKGLQPSLQINYDSDAQNGWLGLGWNLRVSSIEIDTTFGVPRYDGSESYLVDGARLAPTAPGSNRFLRRVESSFERIERTGALPDAFHWVVTDKNGTRFIYGESAAARLADPANANRIFRWMLERVEDTFGNQMHFSYFTDSGNNGEPFVQIYPERIDYTSHPGSGLAAAYHVDFVRDGGSRPDAMISGRSGFQVKTRFLLQHVDVRLGQTELIRRYVLGYETGAFEKQLLTSVAMRGAGTPAAPGVELYRHALEYFPLPRNDQGQFRPFGSRETWGEAHREKDGLSRIEDSTSGGSGGGGIGIGAGAAKIAITASGGGFTGDEKAPLGFFDITGDGLAELVDQGTTSFNRLRVGSGQSHFNADSFAGINLVRDALGHTDRSGWMVEGGLSAFGFSGGVSYTKTTTEDDKIVTDVNGDGFADLASVRDDELFVQLNDGRRSFGPPTSWGALALDQTPSGFGTDPAVEARFHPVDPLVRWNAPFGGQVTISGQLKKILPGGAGVRAEIFHNGVRIWQHEIAQNDLSTCSLAASDGCGGGGISIGNVQAGDRIYTKLHALGNPSPFDDVSWQTRIEYAVDAALRELREPYGSFIYRFDHEADHRLAGRPKLAWVASAGRRVQVTGDVVKQATSDEVRIRVTKRTSLGVEEPIVNELLGANAPGLSINESVEVLTGDSIFFEMLSDSPIDPARVTWEPLVTYTEFCRVDPSNDPPNSVACGQVSCAPGDSGRVTCSIANDPTPETPIPFEIIQRSAEVFVPTFQYLPAQPTQTHVELAGASRNLQLFIFGAPGPTKAYIQGVHRLHEKQDFPSGATLASVSETAELAQNEQVFFIIVTEGNPAAVSAIASVDGVLVPVNVRTPDLSFDETVPFLGVPIDAFSGGFHRWFTGFYNGALAFDETRLRFPLSGSNSGFLFATPSRAGLPNLLQPPDADPIPTAPLWLNGESDAHIGALRQKPSKVGRLTGFQTPREEGGYVAGLRKAETYNVEFEASAGPFGLAYNEGATTTNLDFLDMNGDRYPDSVANDGIAFNGGNGGFAAKGGPSIPGGRMRHVEHRTVRANATVEGSLINQTDSAGEPKSLLTTGITLGIDYGLSSGHVDLVDINGDGLPDRIEQEPNSQEIRVRLNLGYRFSNTIVWQNPHFTKDDYTTGDEIGDKARDIIQFFSDKVGVRTLRLQDTGGKTASLGLDSDVFGLGGGGGINYSVSRSIVEFVDMNGDGLPDQVMKDPGAPDLFVKLNLGDRFAAEQIWPMPVWGIDIDPPEYLFMGTGDALGFRRQTSFNASFSVEVCFVLCGKASGFTSSGTGWSQLAFEDINGDGYTDHVLKLDGNRTVHTKLSQIGKTNLLRRVVRPLGGSFELEYEREGNEVLLAASPSTEPSIDMPTNQWVLARVTLAERVGPTQYVREFRHRRGPDVLTDPNNRGTGFYDRKERENYGYSLTLTTREDASTLETQTHNQDYYRHGLVKETLQRDGAGLLFGRQQLQYREPPAPDFQGAFFPAETLRTISWYEGTTADPEAPGKSAREHRDWDERGNLTSFIEENDDGPEDDLTYTIGYHFEEAPYVNKPSSVEARDHQGTLLRKRTATYVPGNGAPDTVTHVVVGGINPDTGSPYTGADGTNSTWDFDYDQVGNLVTVTDPRQFVLTYGYDAFTRTYRTSTTDSFGYTSEAVPDHRFGAFTELTDTNGHKLVQLFDAFGRIWQVYGPSDVGSTQPTILFTYSQALVPTANSLDQPVPAWARTAHKDVTRTDDTELVTVTFADGLARTIQTKKDLERAATTGSEVGMSVSGRVVFDARGRVAEQGQPDFRPGQGIGIDTAFVADIAAIHPTRFHYDVLSRTRRVEAPDSRASGGFAVTTTDYDFGSLDGGTTFRTTIVDPNGNAASNPADRNPRVTHQDVGESIIAVEEINRIGGTDRTLVTRYAYNAVSELIGVRDARDNITTAEYDTVGRMVLLENEDTGRTQWRYDRSGNLAAKETAKLRAKNQLIRYEYDFNRLRQVSYPESAPVVFTYGTKDEKGDAFGNVAGRIKREQSEAGLKDLRYDRLGNVAVQTNTWERIRVPAQGPYSATMRYQYDSFSRLLSMQFPGLGEEVVTYGYDRGGLVNFAFGVRSEVKHPHDPVLTFYLLNIGYDVFEQRTRVIYGNGLQTDYRYDERTRRLDRIDSSFEPQIGPPHNRVERPFQNLRYEYDLVGSLRSIRNEAPFDDRLTDVFVGTTQQTFQYDKLYQLTQADGIYQDESKSRERYSLGFTYDEIGNIVVKDQQSFRDLPDPQTGEWRPDFPNAEQTYNSVYTYGSGRPHAPTLITETLVNDQTRLREISYDQSGNQTGWVYHHSQVREVDFNEEDRISEVRELGQRLTRVFYDGSGERGVHVSYYGNHETAYLGQNLTIRNAEYPTKHIYAGDTLIASKLDPEWFSHPPTLYFHPDHLGSANYATNDLQELTQHDEFFPTGEVWQAQTEGRYANRRLTTFTGKELDEGTGLYYFGARWYHPRLSQWVSPDPILSEYLQGSPNGGVHTPINLGLYTYTGNNPIILRDEQGKHPVIIAVATGVGIVLATSDEEARNMAIGAFAGIGIGAIGGRALGWARGLLRSPKPPPPVTPPPVKPPVVEAPAGPTPPPPPAVKPPTPAAPAAQPPPPPAAPAAPTPAATPAAPVAPKAGGPPAAAPKAKVPRTKTDKLQQHTLESDLVGAAREAKTGIPHGGQHLKEVSEASVGLSRRVEQLKKALSNPKLTPDQRAALQTELGQASKSLDAAKQAVKGVHKRHNKP